MAITYELSRIDELGKLERFAGADSRAADEAFVQLSSRIERFLWRYLALHSPNEQDREDVISMVLQKLYAKRSEFDVKSIGQWWAYVATTGKRCAGDHAKRGDDVPIDDDLPATDMDLIGSVAELSHFRSMLYRAADEFWLGVPRTLPEKQRRRMLLAAQLFYLNGAPHVEICQVLGLGKPLDREELDEWLSDRAVLMDLAYSQLYIDNETLACTLLGRDRALSPKELDAWVAGAEKGDGEAPQGWTWEEIKIAVWRYRNGLLTEKMQQINPGLSLKMIESALAKCSPRLPFVKTARNLQTALKQKHVLFEPLSRTELWRRLVFQYLTAHELPHKQILERTEAAAKVAGFGMTAAMLNGWLSNGRLVTQLAANIKEETFA